MNLTRIAVLAVTGTMLALPAFAHGGQYRGPGDTVPPGGGGGGGRSGGGGPTTPGPGGPSTPGPGGPTTPGPTTPTGPSGGPARGGGPTTGGRGVQLGDDLNQWQFWWEFNKDPFLQLKSRIWSGGTVTGDDDIAVGRGIQETKSDTLRPSESDLKGKVIPALKDALEDPSSNRDIVSSAMVALAKIGNDPTILPLIKKHLTSGDQEKKETAALAMGISALPEALDDLVALATDNKEGRDMTKATEVDFRTRSFACYGCGLVAFKQTDVAVKRKVFEAMKSILDDKRESRRDVMVAALNAIRLLRPSSEGEGKKLRDEAVDYLLGYIDRSDREVFAQIRAHGYTAIAKLLGRSEGNSKAKDRIVKALKSNKEKQWIYQSAILALGVMAGPDDKDASEAIQDYYDKGKDQQAQRFCAIALGQIGGEDNQKFLRKKLTNSRTQTIMQPWLALGLGIINFNERKNDAGSLTDSSVADVRSVYSKTKSPEPAAGIAIALGIFKDKDVEDEILGRMLDYKNNDEAAGYHAVALGLIGHGLAKEDINQLLEKSERRDKLLTQCAIALGLLGDKEVGLKLVDRLKDDSNPVAVSSALSQALGFIGDRRSIDGLVTLLKNKQLKDIPRAFAAVALGLIGDKEELPWNSKIAVNINYRANVETLTGNSTGVLDIL
ncbi:MAG: hypothetical protein H6833_00125 [Planctomycetes bacterium]|nr:hypothetical protein [Planctomycetota bacterium]